MNWLSVGSLISALIYFYLGSQALQRDLKSSTNRVFAALCLSLVLWSFSYAFIYGGSLEEISLVFFWYRISSIGWILFPAFILLFGLVLTKKEKKMTKKSWLLLLSLLFLPAAVMLIRSLTGILFIQEFQHTSLGLIEIVDEKSFWFLLYNIYLLFYVPGMFLLVYSWGRRSPYQRERIQSKIIVVSGVGVLLAGTSTNLFLPALGYKIPALAPIFTIVWAVGIWISIEKYKLMSLHFGLAADQILETVKDYLVLIDPEGMIVKVNRELKNALNCHVSLSGFPFSKLFAEKDLLDIYLDQLKTGNCPQESREFHFISWNRDDDHIPVRLSCSPIYDGSGDILGAVITGHDLRNIRELQEKIKEKIEAEKALRQSNERLKELDQLKTDFLSTVSHELRTPLTSILGFAKIMKKRYQEVILPQVEVKDKKVERTLKQFNENMDIIVSEGERLTKMINDVLDIAKIESGRVEWNKEVLTFQEIIKSAIISTKHLFQEKGLYLKKELPGEKLIILGDKDRLIQVLINLLSNGLKFTDKGGVTVSTTRDNNQKILVQVKDTGEGISPEDQEKVFEKFKQVGETLTNKPKGTGLGLPICKQIIEHHDGHIWVESMKGEGSIFSITLPLYDGKTDIDESSTKNQQEKVAKTLEEPKVRIQKKRILLVDDEENIRKYLKSELEEKGYQAIEARNGKEGLEMMKKKRPHLIILDVLMPVMDGFTMLEMIREEPNWAEIPVIIVTIVEEKERALKKGVEVFFPKPIDIGALLTKIQEIIS